MKKLLFIIFLFICTFLSAQRVVVLTDPNILTTKETDDALSLVRLMVYSNEFEIEGLIATCSHNYGYRHVEPIHDAIDAYESVLPNLQSHDTGYPDPDYLRSITVLGPRLYGTQFALLESPISDGGRLLIDIIDKDDDRPIWIQIWGDGATIVQALEEIRKTRGEGAAQDAASRLRILDLAGQDDSGAWLKSQDHYPDLFYIRWINQYVAMDPMSDIRLDFYPYCGECAKGEGDYTTDEWVAEHIQSHGILGAAYPNRRYLKEGDTPTMLYMIPNGLNNPEKPWQGSWGGRFTHLTVTGVRSTNHPLGDSDEYTETEFDPYYMYGPAEDSWNGYNNSYAPIFRWWSEFQNDFAARMDWSVTPLYENANHPPEIIIEETSIDVFKGELISIRALGLDPDNNLLTYEWWYYKEAGTYDSDVVISNSDTPTSFVSIPDDAGNSELHIILSVTDNGYPALTRYKRIILNVYETFIDYLPPTIPQYLEGSILSLLPSGPGEIQSSTLLSAAGWTRTTEPRREQIYSLP